MFFPPKHKTLFSAVMALALAVTSNSVLAQEDQSGRSAEFERRAAAMRRARTRGKAAEPVARVAQAQPNTTARSAQAQRVDEAISSPAVHSVVAPSARPTRAMPVANAVGNARRRVRAQAQAGRSGGRMMQASSGGYVPQHLQNSEMIYDGSVVGGQIVDGYSGGEVIYGDGDMLGGSVIHDGAVIDDSYGLDAGCSSCSSGCDSCGVTGGYFEGGGCESGCCNRGGCPPGPCWINRFGNAFRNGEFFGGAVAFQSPLFTVPGQGVPVDEDQLASDSSFGFYGGFNLGIPLCRLSCGLLSGQFGIRSVNTNFDGNEFTHEDRRQIFVTTGVYRRVDYGLQFGAVADILHEEWFTETDLVQIRADLGWVYPAGHVLGFRYATGVQDELTEGAFNGRDFTDMFHTTDDNYRLYYRHAASWGGWGEAFVGWAEADQTLIGLDVDLPVTDRVSFQSGFTAYLGDEVVADNSNFQGGQINEAWNVYVGMSLKPRGRSWYRSYDRPMFAVADNGSMIVRRQSPEISATP